MVEASPTPVRSNGNAVATTRCILWDFGDTLCDETFIWNSGPEWMDVYRTLDSGLGASWNLGQMDTQRFAAELSQRMTLTADAIVAHMIERCQHVEFFARTYEFFKSHAVPQAIVTVNPDLFTNVIEPAYRLGQSCEAIVTSWQEQTVDKAALCKVAIERLGLSCSNRQALLIDNKRSNIEAWTRREGAGYVYTTDEQFGRDIAKGIDSLSNAARD